MGGNGVTKTGEAPTWANESWQQLKPVSDAIYSGDFNLKYSGYYLEMANDSLYKSLMHKHRPDYGLLGHAQGKSLANKSPVNTRVLIATPAFNPKSKMSGMEQRFLRMNLNPSYRSALGSLSYLGSVAMLGYSIFDMFHFMTPETYCNNPGEILWRMMNVGVASGAAVGHSFLISNALHYNHVGRPYIPYGWQPRVRFVARSSIAIFPMMVSASQIYQDHSREEVSGAEKGWNYVDMVGSVQMGTSIFLHGTRTFALAASLMSTGLGISVVAQLAHAEAEENRVAKQLADAVRELAATGSDEALNEVLYDKYGELDDDAIIDFFEEQVDKDPELQDSKLWRSYKMRNLRARILEELSGEGLFAFQSPKEESYALWVVTHEKEHAKIEKHIDGMSVGGFREFSDLSYRWDFVMQDLHPCGHGEEYAGTVLEHVDQAYETPPSL